MKQYTQAQIDEAARLAATDPRYLIESTFNILNKDSKKVPFIFNPTQDHYWKARTPRDIVDKSRKLGVTSIEIANMLAECSQKENQKGVVVSIKEDAAIDALSRAKYMIENCEIDLGFKVNNETLMCKKTKSMVWVGMAGAKGFGRGSDITHILATEYAHWPNAEIMTGLEEACVRNSRICIESTANGYGNHFHQLYTKSTMQEVGMILPDGAPRTYTPHFYGWNWDPELSVPCKDLTDRDEYEKRIKERFNLTDAQLYWRRLKIKAMTEPHLFPQEFPITWEESFLQAGSMLFDAFALQDHERTARKPLWRGEIRDKGDRVGMDHREDGRLTIYLSPEDRHTYLISGDVGAGIRGDKASGREGDFSVWDVFDLTTCEQVAQWRGHIPPDQFGDVGVLLGAFYNFALLVPELNNHGWACCTAIKKAEYPNLYHRQDETGGSSMGWYTSPGKMGTRVELVDTARASVRDFSIKLNSLHTIGECRTFVTTDKNDIGEAQEGCKDDCVISMGIGAVMLKRMAGIPEERKESFKARLGYRPEHKPRITAPTFKKGYA